MTRILENFNIVLEKLPFKCGKNHDKVPYIFDGELADIISLSLQKLVELIKERYGKRVKSRYSAFLPLSTNNVHKVARDRRLSTRDLISKPLEKNIAEEVICHNPYVDAGILVSWFTQDSGAARLTWGIKKLYMKAVAEDMKRGGGIDFTTITHLCLVDYLRKTKEGLKNVAIKGLSYEKLDQTVAQIFYSVIRAIQGDLFGEIRYRDLTFDMIRLEGCIKAITNPLIFTTTKATLLNNDLNPYHLDQVSYALLQRLHQKTDSDCHDMKGAVRQLLNIVKGDKKGRDKLLELWVINRFRRAVFDYLKDFEGDGQGTDLWLEYLFRNNKLIRNALTQGEAGRRLLDDLSKIKMEAVGPHKEERIARIAAIQNVFKSYKKGRILKWLLFRSSVNAQLEEVIGDFLLYQLDMARDLETQRLLGHLEDRMSVKQRVELAEDYKRGRVYRFATDTQPILQDLTAQKEGHLFLDLRGFTHHISKSKDIVKADSTLKDFFLPALQVAKTFVTDEGVRLNSFLGNTLSFSGDTESLVRLAQQLREIFNSYTRKLKERRKSVGNTHESKAIEDRYQNEKTAIIRRSKAIEHSLYNIETELRIKESLNPFNILKVQEEEFVTKLSHCQNEIVSLTTQIEHEQDRTQRRVLVGLRKDLISLREEINDQHKLLAETIEAIGKDELREIFRLACAEERNAIEQLRNDLKYSHDQELELTRAYRKQIPAPWDDEVEYGLFISYGNTADLVSFNDEFWGSVDVAIADKLNEAARGAERNLELRRKLELRLANARGLRDNPSLQYPFNVFIDKSFGMTIQSDLVTKINLALRGRDTETARELVRTISSLLLRDIERGMHGIGEEGWELLTPVNEIYNHGEAISEEALTAYLKETSSHKNYFEKQVTVSNLHPDIHNRFFFPSNKLKLIISAERVENKVHFDLFNYVGELVLKGFENHKPTEVYEIIRKDSSFYQLLKKHHLSAWYNEAQSNISQRRVA